VEFYKAAKKKFDSDVEFKEASRNEVVKLQSGFFFCFFLVFLFILLLMLLFK
jgi:hypothetical protein